MERHTNLPALVYSGAGGIKKLKKNETKQSTAK
jgi:hypothetical protein